MSINSTRTACNHKALEVSLLLLGSVVAGLLGGVLSAAFGSAPGLAVANGASATVAVFGIGMAVISYMKHQ